MHEESGSVHIDLLGVFLTTSQRNRRLALQVIRRRGRAILHALWQHVAHLADKRFSLHQPTKDLPTEGSDHLKGHDDRYRDTPQRMAKVQNRLSRIYVTTTRTTPTSRSEYWTWTTPFRSWPWCVQSAICHLRLPCNSLSCRWLRSRSFWMRMARDRLRLKRRIRQPEPILTNVWHHRCSTTLVVCPCSSCGQKHRQLSAGRFIPWTPGRQRTQWGVVSVVSGGAAVSMFSCFCVLISQERGMMSYVNEVDAGVAYAIMWLSANRITLGQNRQ